MPAPDATTKRKSTGSAPPPPDLTNIRKYGQTIAALLRQFQDGSPSVIVVNGGMYTATSTTSLVADILDGKFIHARPGVYANFRAKSGAEVAISLEKGQNASGQAITIVFLH